MALYHIIFIPIVPIMKCFSCCLALCLLLSHAHAQSAADLSYVEIDSLLLLYEKQPRKHAAEGIQLALEASRLTGKEDSLCGEYLEWATAFYEAKDDHSAALACYQKALAIFEQTPGKESARYAKTLFFFGTFHFKMGNYQEALPLLLQAKDIQARTLGQEHPYFALSLNNLAALYEDMGHYQKALPLLMQAKDIQARTLGTTHRHFAASLKRLASLYQKMDDYDKALPLLMQAKDIQAKVLGENHPYFASSLNSLANLYQQMGQYNRALPLHIKAKDILENALGPEHPKFASALGYLAHLYKDKKQYDLALPLYLQAQSIQVNMLGENHPQVAISMNNLAYLYQKMGRYDQALPLFLQAKDIRAKTLGQAHPYFANSLNNLATLYQQMGQYDQAWTTAQQALASATGQPLSVEVTPAWADTILTTAFASNQHRRRVILTLHILYGLLEQEDRIQTTQQQIILSDLAVALLAQYRSHVSSDQDKLRLLKYSHDWLQRNLKHLHGLDQDHKAFALVDQNKSVLLLEATRSEQAYQLGHLPDAMVWKDRKLGQQKSQLQAQLLEQRPSVEKDSLRVVLNAVNQSIDALEAQIQKDYPKYYQLKYQPPTIAAADVQALLDDQTALLEYVIGDSAVHIFYLDPQKVVWKKQLVAKSALKRRIKRLHQALSQPWQIESDPLRAYQRYTAQAHWFYEQLLAPVLEGQSGLKNLIIVTDGELGHLPFEAFLVTPALQGTMAYHQLHYLLNDYNISYHYSAALWQENKQAPAPKNNGQIFGVAANYDLQLDSALLDIRLPTDQWMRSSLTPLPGARQEVELLQDRYRGFFAFDSLASERVVKQKASDFAILHFATHGLLNEKRPMLSSLALSEDNDPIESNFWQAHEISKMTLNANLVVLSACQTGYGKFEQGNGIASLARAFMYAGAPSMVVSLWPVNDYATAEMMQYFYQHLTAGLPVDQALRQAKLQYLETAVGPAAHPAFWSPFIHMGQTAPVALQTKGWGLWMWVLLGALGLLVLGGSWAMLRRRERAV